MLFTAARTSEPEIAVQCSVKRARDLRMEESIA